MNAEWKLRSALDDDERLGHSPFVTLCPHLVGQPWAERWRRGPRMLCEECAEAWDRGDLTAQDLEGEPF